MKRFIFLVLSIILLITIILVGKEIILSFSSSKNTPITPTEKFLNRYKSINKKVINILSNFSKQDEAFSREEISLEEYFEAWDDLNRNLKEIDKQVEGLGKSPKDAKKVTDDYNKGLNKIIDVSNSFLNIATDDADIIYEKRLEFNKSVDSLRYASSEIVKLLSRNNTRQSQSNSPLFEMIENILNLF